MNERKKGIVISYINIILHAMIGFLYVPILLHYIGTSEYGLYQLIGSLIAYFSIMDFGLSTAIVRFYTKYKAINDKIGMENILAISLRGYAMIAVLVFILGGVCYFLLGEVFSASMTVVEIMQIKQLFLLLLFNIVFTLTTMIFRSVINAHERFQFLKGMETIELVCQPVVIILVLQEYPSAFSVAMVQTVLNIVLTGIRAYYCFTSLHMTIRFHYWNRELFHDFKRLALSVFAVMVIDQLFFKTNQIILGIISGAAAVAVYSIASLIYMNYMALSMAISEVYLPHVTALVAKREPIERLSSLFIQIGRWQYYLLALVSTGFIIFGKQFIEFWAGKGFEDAYWITLLIIIPFTIDLIQNIGLSILKAKNQYGFRARVYFGIGILNLGLAIPLGTKYGGMGCAVATGLSMLIGNGLIMNWFYAKQIKLDIREFWRQIAKITIPIGICLILGYIFNMMVYSVSKNVFMIKIIIYFIIYGLILYKCGMNIEEKNKIKCIVLKVKQ